MAARPADSPLQTSQALNSNAPVFYPNILFESHANREAPTLRSERKKGNKGQHAAHTRSANKTYQPMTSPRKPSTVTIAISHPIAQSSNLMAASSANSPLPTQQAQDQKEPTIFPSSPSLHTRKLNPARKSCPPAYTNTKAHVYVNKTANRAKYAAPSTSANETNQPTALPRQTLAGTTTTSHPIAQSSYSMEANSADLPLSTRQAQTLKAPATYPSSLSSHTREINPTSKPCFLVYTNTKANDSVKKRRIESNMKLHLPLQTRQTSPWHIHAKLQPRPDPLPI